MADDVLRMRAVIVNDQALASARELARAIGVVAQKGGQGAKVANAEWAAFGNTIKRVGTELRGAIPAFGGVGLGAAGAGLAFGALIRTINNASKELVELKHASKEVGLSERDLRGWTAAAAGMGLSAEQVVSSLQGFKEVTDGLKYNLGGVRGELLGMGATQVVARLMATSDQAERLKVALDYRDVLMRMDKSGTKARDFLDRLKLGNVGLRMSLKDAQEASERLTPIDPKHAEAAKKYQIELGILGAKWDELIVKGATPIFPWLTSTIEGVIKLIDMMEKLRITNTAAQTKPLPENAPKWLKDWSQSKFFKGGAGGPAPAAPGATSPGSAAPNAAPPGGLPFSERFPGAGEFIAPNIQQQNRNKFLQYKKTSNVDGGLKVIGDNPLLDGGGRPSGIQTASYGGGGGGESEASRVIQKGVFDALVDFQSYSRMQDGGGGGGFTNASLSGGGGGGGFGTGAGTGGGGGGEGGAPSGSSIPAAPGSNTSKGGAPGVPDVGPMTEQERNNLGLIQKYESGGRNVLNFAGKAQGIPLDKKFGSTAQGYYQILNTNWRRLAPGLGIKTPNAMASSLEDQTKVALALMREKGQKIGHWANYNPRLRAALGRGEQAGPWAGKVPQGDTAGAPGAPGGAPGQMPAPGQRQEGGAADGGGATLYPRRADGSLHPTEASMNPELRGRLLAMKADSPYGGAGLQGGRSGGRSYQDQVNIYRESRPGYAAKPGRSRHSDWLPGGARAADLKYGSAAERRWYHQNAAKYGIKYPMGHEPWHAEADPNYRGPSRIDQANKPGGVPSSVAVNIQSNGTKAAVRVAREGTGFQEPEIREQRQFTETQAAQPVSP